MATNAQGQVVPDGMAPNWQVTGQQERLRPGPNGVTRDVIVVSFMVNGEGPFSVDVDKNLYNPANVQAAITQYAARLHEVRKLQG